MTNNPYSVTSEGGYQMPAGSTGGAVDAGVVQVLVATRPWVRFIAVLMFVATGLMLLVSLAMLVTAGTAAAKVGGVSGAGLSGAALAGMAVGYGLIALFYIFPALKLWRYASGINTLAQLQDNASLVAALDQQRSFWKFIGIMILCMIGLYFLIFIGAIIVGVKAAS